LCPLSYTLIGPMELSFIVVEARTRLASAWRSGSKLVFRHWMLEYFDSVRPELVEGTNGLSTGFFYTSFVLRYQHHHRYTTSPLILNETDLLTVFPLLFPQSNAPSTLPLLI
jgi:hypothetical protein